MKICTECGKNKPIESFQPQTRRMCNPCRSRFYNARYARKRLHELAEYKLHHGCKVCGYNKCSAVLDFHHLDPNNKEGNVGIVAGGSNRWKEEAAKCVVLCRNCHMEYHSGLIGDSTISCDINKN